MKSQILIGREKSHLKNGHAQELDGRGPAEQSAHANQGHGGGYIRINDVLQGEAVDAKRRGNTINRKCDTWHALCRIKNGDNFTEKLPSNEMEYIIRQNCLYIYTEKFKRNNEFPGMFGKIILVL